MVLQEKGPYLLTVHIHILQPDRISLFELSDTVDDMDKRKSLWDCADMQADLDLLLSHKTCDFSVVTQN